MCPPFGVYTRRAVSIPCAVMSLWRLVLSGRGPPYQPSPYPSGRTLLSREETTPRSTPITDGSIPGEQQVQVKVLIRPGLEPETSQPQRSALPLDHAGWLRARVAAGVVRRLPLPRCQ